MSEALKSCPSCGGQNLSKVVHVAGMKPCVMCLDCKMSAVSVETWNTRADLPSKTCVDVKPLEWRGLFSGPYEIRSSQVGNDAAIIDLFDHSNCDEYGVPEFVDGGYITLVSVEELKAEANARHREQILSAITTRTVAEVQAEARKAALEEAATYIDEMRFSTRGQAIRAIRALAEKEKKDDA